MTTILIIACVLLVFVLGASFYKNIILLPLLDDVCCQFNEKLVNSDQNDTDILHYTAGVIDTLTAICAGVGEELDVVRETGSES